MNTTPVTLRELATISVRANKVLSQAAVTISIANGAIEALSKGQPMRAGQIAEAIGEVGIQWNGLPCKVSPQKVSNVMRRLIKLGRVKAEEVEGEPMEIQVREHYKRSEETFKLELIPAHTKTITPKTKYYSLV